MSRKDKKTVHIPKELHKIIQLYKVEKNISSIEKVVEKLIITGLKNEDMPNRAIMDKLGTYETKKQYEERELKQLSDIKLVNFVENVEGTVKGKEITDDETMREITYKCLKYLMSVGEAKPEDFKNNVYPEFEGEHTKESFMKIARLGMDQLTAYDLLRILGDYEDKENLVYEWRLWKNP